MSMRPCPLAPPPAAESCAKTSCPGSEDGARCSFVQMSCAEGEQPEVGCQERTGLAESWHSVSVTVKGSNAPVTASTSPKVLEALDVCVCGRRYISESCSPSLVKLSPTMKPTSACMRSASASFLRLFDLPTSF